MTAQRILDRKGATTVTIPAATSVKEAAETLSRHNIGALVVSEDGLRVEGLFSERDLAHGIAEEGPDFVNKPVGDVMTTAVETCKPGDTIHEMLAKMTNKRIRHLPVVNEGQLAGMVSIGDVVKLRLDELAVEAEAMRNYIAGAG